MARGDEFDPRIEGTQFEVPIAPRDRIVENDDEMDGDGDLEDVQATITRLIEEAVDFYEEHLEPDQEKATDYYHARPFGDEQEGRSQVVATDVRDATLSQLPSLLRIFTGSDRAVEFRADSKEHKEMARVKTDYVNHVFLEDNPGYLILDSAFKDALIRRLGIVTWWWDDNPPPEGATFTGISRDDLIYLLNDDEVENVDIIGERMNPLIPGGSAYDVEVMWRVRGRAMVEAVPNEEFVFTPDARGVDQAPLVAHVKEMPAGDLIAMGIPEDEVYRAVGEMDDITGGLEDVRQFHGGERAGKVGRDADKLPRSQRPVIYARAYARIDVNGDGISELREFECIGPQYRIMNGDGEGEVVDDVPFAVFSPILEPHTIVGLSNWDLLHQIQRINSQIERGMLNSLAKAIDPPTEVVNNEVNMRDVLSPAASKIIRVRRPGMIREVVQDYIGPHAIATLEYFKDKRSDAVGMTRASEGLDPNSLQSSTEEAVSATLSRSQEHIQYIARNFAEVGMKRLFLGLLKLCIKNQDYARPVEMRGQYVQVDPRVWTVEQRITVSSALGTGSIRDKTAALQAIAADQLELKAQGSPLVTDVEIRNVRQRMVELIGYVDTEEFYRAWTAEQQDQLEQQMAANPPKSFEDRLADIEETKAQFQMQLDQQKFELERWKARMEDDRERDKAAMDATLKEREIEAKHQVDIHDAELKAQVQDRRNEMDADVKVLAASQTQRETTTQE